MKRVLFPLIFIFTLTVFAQSPITTPPTQPVPPPPTPVPSSNEKILSDAEHPERGTKEMNKKNKSRKKGNVVPMNTNPGGRPPVVAPATPPAPTPDAIPPGQGSANK